MADPSIDTDGKPVPGTGLTYSSISQRLTAIDKVGASTRFPVPGNDPDVKRLMRGVRRTIHVAPQRRAANLELEDLLRIANAVRHPPYLKIRDAAIVGLSKSIPGELASLSWSDISRAPTVTWCGVGVTVRRVTSRWPTLKASTTS